MNKTPDPIQAFRQPMVTAIALILGFGIGFLADWLTDVDFRIDDSADVILIFGMTISSLVLIIALFRILKMDYPREQVQKYYNRTLWFFIIGLSILFLCLTLCFMV